MQQSSNFQKPSLSYSCPIDWNKMTLCEEGRFCGSCQKTVLDFTQKSDAEIKKILTKQTGEVCGRFYSNQLAQPGNSNRSSFRRVFSSVLVLLGLSFLSKEAEAQQNSTIKKLPVKGKSQVKQQVKSKRKAFDVVKQDDVIVVGAIAVEKLPSSPDLTDIEGTPKSEDTTSAIFVDPEISPVYKFGGETGMQKFIAENKRTVSDRTEGLVAVSFIVDTLGKVHNIKVVKSLTPLTDEEAVRLSKMLEFEPGMLNGRKVKVQYTVPIHFKYD